MNKGYIYIRNNESYNKYNVCKLGITTNLYNRHSTYKTNEIICGKFILIILFYLYVFVFLNVFYDVIIDLV